MKRIAVLVDFTGVCEIAIAHAGMVAKKSKAALLLLHVAPYTSRGNQRELEAELKIYGEILDADAIPFNVQVNFGDFFEIIPNILAELKTDLLVVGTHAIQGKQRNLYSDNILRLLNSTNVLTLLVQRHSPFPPAAYGKILVPLLDEVYSISNASSLAQFAGFFNANLQLLNFIFEDDEDGLTISHIDVIKKQFEELGRPLAYKHKTTSIYVGSYSKTIAQYAETEECQLISWVMPATENTAKHFSDEDKMSLMLNKPGIPVLCWTI